MMNNQYPQEMLAGQNYDWQNQGGYLDPRNQPHYNDNYAYDGTQAYVPQQPLPQQPLPQQPLPQQPLPQQPYYYPEDYSQDQFSRAQPARMSTSPQKYISVPVDQSAGRMYAQSQPLTREEEMYLQEGRRQAYSHSGAPLMFRQNSRVVREVSPSKNMQYHHEPHSGYFSDGDDYDIRYNNHRTARDPYHHHHRRSDYYSGHNDAHRGVRRAEQERRDRHLHQERSKNRQSHRYDDLVAEKERYKKRESDRYNDRRPAQDRFNFSDMHAALPRPDYDDRRVSSRKPKHYYDDHERKPRYSGEYRKTNYASGHYY